MWCMGCRCVDSPTADKHEDELLVEQAPVDSEPVEHGADTELTVKQDEEEVCDIEGFAGFSEDEKLFAYSAYSRGADTHIFTVVDSLEGRRITDFPLDGEGARARARSLLTEGGFSSQARDGSGVLDRDEILRLDAEPGGVRVWLVRGEDRVALEPPAAMAEVASRLDDPSADVWGFSPSGAYVAVRLAEDQGSVLGEAVTYQILGMEPARLALR